MNFLQAYHIYSSGNEAPDIFHQWGAYAVLSSCCGPNIWKDMGTIGNIQPNLYIMFVGPPGIKKSTAKDIAKRLVHKIHTNKHPLPMAPASCTKEALIKFMAEEKSPCQMSFAWQDKLRKYTKLSIYSDEFVNLVQVGGDPLAWVQLLTEIYNPQPSFDAATIARGSVNLPYPYVTLLGCMTPELTKSLINENALSGGFSRRTLYLFANRNSKPVPEPVITPEQKEAEVTLVEHGRRIQSLTGKFEFSSKGRELYNNWYAQNFHELESSTSAAQQNFLQSKSVQVIKVAMLSKLAVSNELILDEEEMELAIALVTDAQRHIDTIFAGVGRNPHAATMSGIQNFIKFHCERPPHYVTRKKIYANFLNHASQKDIDSLIDQMTAVEQIKQVQAQFNNGQVLQVVTTPEFFMSFQKKP
ncbi:MAG TPA: DUF3987 domain-containing protein [Leptospiraceae bacterium]|nr:DUF3987 domain-containing protein [Leptospiraceae bacterium]